MIRSIACCITVLAILAGCSDDTPTAPVVSTPAPAPITYDYLPKLALDVSDVVLDDTWTPLASSGVHVEDEATPRPVDALSRMIRDRIVASGGPGRAMVVIEDASLVRLPDQIVGSFSVQITLDGTPNPPPDPVIATVSGTRTLASDPNEAATANTLLRDLMQRMNVEIEYQVRHSLKTHLGGSASPVPTPVQSQDLAPPPGTTAVPPPAAPGLLGAPIKLAPPS